MKRERGPVTENVRVERKFARLALFVHNAVDIAFDVATGKVTLYKFAERYHYPYRVYSYVVWMKSNLHPLLPPLT